MLIREITYEDYDGNQCTDTYCFHLTKTEILKILAEYEGGFEEEFKRIQEKKDNKQLIILFDRIVLGALGIKADDGKRFIKTEEIREKFTQTLAYDALFMELSTGTEAFTEFVNGVFPKGLREDMTAAIVEQTKQLES